MNLFRLLALALLLWIGWFLLKNWLARQRKAADTPARRLAGKVVKCRHCDLHLPEADAVPEGDDWFCSQAHRQAWLRRS
ncbi:MAG: PP0621 family protein [Pseudohongiellaceae bacterium]|jgi:uncharacterized protein